MSDSVANQFETRWPLLDNGMGPPSGEVHLWYVSLDETADLEPLRSLLSHDELRRAARFMFEQHQRRFIVGRAALRQVLGHYLRLDAQDVAFDYSGLGKPRLHGNPPHHGLCFNFSNSHERALLAVTKDLEIGVDIERVRTMESLEGLAERFFADAEKRAILPLSEPRKTDTFFRCWTRKEAFLKAIGKGLTFPLCDVTVDLQPESPIRITCINDDAQDAADWTLQHVDVEPAYVAALAYKQSPRKTRRFRWTSTP